MIKPEQQQSQLVTAIEELAGSLDGDSFGVEIRVRDEYLMRVDGWRQTVSYALEKIIDELARKVVVRTIGGMYTIHWNISELRDMSDYCHIIRAKVDLWKVKEVPIVYKIAHSVNDLPDDVYSCKWCGGYTKNDHRGNCAACGAPRDGSDKSWGTGG